MSSIVLIGSDLTLLEGLAQTLAAAGCRTAIAGAPRDIAPKPGAGLPLIAVVERRTAVEAVRSGGLPGLAPGGSVVLYHDSDDGPMPLPATLQRITLADLTLPLERQRLVALVRSVSARADLRAERGATAPPEARH